MKLQAARDDRRQKSIWRGRGEDEGGRAGRLLENFQENIGYIPAHRLCAVQDENTAATHRLKVGGALNGTQLAHTQHRSRDRTLQPDGIGDERPNVGVRLQN